MLQNRELLQNRKNLLAFSGGADSTALLHLLLENSIAFDIAIVDYGLRDQSKEEVAFARSLAQKHGFSCHLFEAPKIEKNFEAKARELRYGFFESLIFKHDYENLLTAHHLGDRLEWLLMQLSKGAGLYELIGMRSFEEREGYNIVRPLLHLEKSQLLEYLKRSSLEHFEDASNADERYRRNYFRHNYATPLLKKYASGIAKSFEYMEADIDSLVQKVELKRHKKLAYFPSCDSRRSEIIAIDSYLKSQNHCITADEKALLQKSYGVVLGRKYCVTQTQQYIFIAPFVKATKMEKKLRERLRLLKIDPKLRGYLSSDEALVAFVSGVLE